MFLLATMMIFLVEASRFTIRAMAFGCRGTHANIAVVTTEGGSTLVKTARTGV